MTVESSACASFWAECLRQLPADHQHRSATPATFAFCGGGPIAHELAALVLQNKKRATSSLPIEFLALNAALPRVDDVIIILDGHLGPVAVIERTSVESLPFDAVGAVFDHQTPVLCQIFQRVWPAPTAERHDP